MMLTAVGCEKRRRRLLAEIKPSHPLLLADPLMLRYYAGVYVDPFHLGADYGGLLKIEPDHATTLYLDARLPASAKQAKVDQIIAVPWYDGKSPGQGGRRESLRHIVESQGGRIHDHYCDPMSRTLWETTARLRRAKDEDEVEVLRACMRACEAGHAWARNNVASGMTELEVYLGVQNACAKVAGHAVIVYGDFAVSPGSSKKGGAPTNYQLKPNDMLILDFSVVLQGYRSDFTNTLVVDGQPNDQQQELFDLSLQAMQAGESLLKAGTPCLAVYQAVREVFSKAGKADYFPHHAGHGLGIAHPEPPFFVEHANETLVAGDVVTLEPGLYIDGIGGLRIEHNYLITTDSYETLSRHHLGLV